MMARSIFARTRAVFLPLAAAVVLATGCQSDQEAAVSVADLMATVPANTPYLAANTEYLPDDVFTHQMQTFAPRLIAVIDAISTMATADGDLSAEDQQRLTALFDAATAYLSDESAWEQYLGVVYGQGIFPVARFALSDPQSTLAKLTELHAEMGVEPQRATQLGDNVFQVTLGHARLSAYYGIVDGYFVATAMPDAASDLLAVSFGRSAPANAYQEADLKAMADSRGYSVGVLGFLDTLELFDQVSSSESSFGQWLAEFDHAHDEVSITDLSPECRDEMRALAAIMPGMDWGGTRFDKTGFDTSSFIQLRPDIAESLVAITGDVPGLKNDPGGDMAFGLSLQIGPLRDFIMQMARNVQEAPFTCESLVEFNQTADDILAQAGTPMPPFVGQVRGLKVRMNEFMRIKEQQAPKVSAALFVENAQLLVSMMGLFVPGLADANIPPDGQPVRLDDSISGALPNVSADAVFAALTDSSIGVALGEDEASQLPEFMAESGGDEGILFSYFMDYGAILEMQRKELEAMDADGTFEIVIDDEEGEDSLETERKTLNIEHTREMMKAMMNLYEVVDRMGSWGQPTNEGLILEQTVSLKE